MFETVRKKVVYPSAVEYQRSDEHEVPASWAAAYLKNLADKYPEATIKGWTTLTVEATVTLTPAQILEEKLNYLKAVLNNIDDPAAKEALSRI